MSLRTWQYWESPKQEGEVKPDVIEKFENLLDLTLRNILATEDAIGELDGTDAENAPITLTRYRNQAALDRAHPNFPGGISAHSQMVANILVYLRSADQDVIILWDDDPLAHIQYDR